MSVTLCVHLGLAVLKAGFCVPVSGGCGEGGSGIGLACMQGLQPRSTSEWG